MIHNEPLRLGVIGAGRWGRNLIRTALALADEGIALTAVATSRVAEAEAWLPSSVRLLPSWQEMLDPARTGTLHALALAVPPQAQTEIALAALRQGIALLLEKPLALDPAAARQVAELSAQTGVPALVDHIFLFHPAFLRLLEEARRVGVRSIRSAGGNRGPFRPEFSPWWDWAPHDAAMILSVMNDAPLAFTRHRPPPAPAPPGEPSGEVFRLDLAFSDQRTATMTVGNGMTEKNRWFEATLSDGSLWRFDDRAPHRLTRRWKNVEEPIPTAETPPLAEALRALARAARGQAVPLEQGAAFAARVVELLATAEAQTPD
ncbi:MAG: Gfo/Idh/MocA family oxidoreductase [Magnetococcales bacterium]|nr:Gfo/Idh/MocA family oxidoreductase [Magnetococcales bacterium]